MLDLVASCRAALPRNDVRLVRYFTAPLDPSRGVTMAARAVTASLLRRASLRSLHGPGLTAVSTAAAAAASGSCSQTRTTTQPSAVRASVTCRSRSQFLRSFGSQ